ncbi:ABC transporter ATP-binding protein [Trebonia kvetii]|uniref:ABC transporter ATP-binding protein n=1 Tax=Trebonia kvetii TaxID=2480626 RepID=A0A6P2BLB2_9ACTN|nr:ABC transporter ATP-binding protein [Trebonia kvetii]TVY99813.1 ABC transporter ATP-binding protein [Trebonia kvetii]
MNEASHAHALTVKNLSVCYRSGWRQQPVTAVDDVSFEIAAGETVGLVGESGSGKSTIVKAVLGLESPSAGKITLNDRDITHTSVRQRRAMVGELRAVFQDPFSSLSPFQTVGQTVTEPLRRQQVSAGRARELAADAVTSVGLHEDALGRYPHQFSGGQRQRIALARALVSDPDVIVMDEPVSALDLSTQAQVLNLLAELRDRRRHAILFVAHDLGVVRFLCQRVIVLYRGMVMESGTAADVTARPKHPYSIALTAAAPVPRPGEQGRRRAVRRAVTVRASAGTVQASDSSEQGSAGCPFAPRCPDASEVCRAQRPLARQLEGRVVACHHAH